MVEVGTLTHAEHVKVSRPAYNNWVRGLSRGDGGLLRAHSPKLQGVQWRQREDIRCSSPALHAQRILPLNAKEVGPYGVASESTQDCAATIWGVAAPASAKLWW